MASQECWLTDAYLVGVKLTAALRTDQSVCTALRTLEEPFDSLDDGYPECHPAPYSFGGMVRRAKEHVPIETALCDREFDSMDVYRGLSNLDINYLIPKRITSSERDAMRQWRQTVGRRPSNGYRLT